MKVLHVMDTSGIGGAQSLLRGIVDNANETDHHAFILRRHDRELLHTAEHTEIFPSKSKFALAPRARLKTLIAEGQYDIVHCHLPRSELFGWSVAQATGNGPLLVAHEHGQILGSDDHGFFTNLAYGQLKRLIRSRFAHHISVSTECKDALISRVNIPDESITIIPSFFDTTEFNSQVRLEKRPALRQVDGIRDDEFVVGIAGRIIAKKGWQVFLKALNIVHKAGHKPRAVVTGNGPDRPEFEQMVSDFGLADSMIDLKWVDDIRDFYSRLDCFVAPSYAEGSPVAAREAMAMGLPIIASTAKGFCDLIDDGDSGLLFEVGNAEQLAQKIILIMQSPDLAELLAQGAGARAQKFSVPNYLGALDDVYRSILQ